MIREFDQTRGYVGDAQAVIDARRAERLLRHAGEGRLLRILDHRDTAAQLDDRQTERAVAERASQHNADHAGAVRACCAAEEHIHRRPGAVLAWSDLQFDSAGSNDQMAVRLRHVDAASLDGIAIFGRRRGQNPRSRQNVRQSARQMRRHVQHDKHRASKVGR